MNNVYGIGAGKWTSFMCSPLAAVSIIGLTVLSYRLWQDGARRNPYSLGGG